MLGEEIKFLKRTLNLIKEQNHSYWKKFREKNRVKNRKYFSAQQYQNFIKQHLRWSKTDLSKEIKRIVLRRDILRILVAIRRFDVKRCPFIFKISLIFGNKPVYFHITKIDIM